MTEVFDTYTKRPGIYYALHLVTVLTFGFLFIAWRIDLKIQPTYRPLVIMLILLGVIGILINIVVTATNFIKMYNVDGVLTLSNEQIIAKSTTITVKNIKKVDIRANDFRGARTSDGSGNWIEITSPDGKRIRCRFVIKSKEQKENLQLILKKWNDEGVDVHS